MAPARRWRRVRDEGNYSGGRFGDPSASGDPGCLQTAAAGLRQADDLLPAVDASAGGDPRDSDYFDPAGYAPLRAITGIGRAVGNLPEVCRAAVAGWSGSGLPDR